MGHLDDDLVGRGVGDGPIGAPIVIVGLHRTGTTLLQHLLAALPGHHYVPMWALMTPAPKAFRRARAYAAVAGSRFAGPELWRIHPVFPRGPEECWMLFMPTFRVFDYALHWRIPRYTAWLDACDMRPAYREYRRTLGVLESNVRPSGGRKP